MLMDDEAEDQWHEVLRCTRGEETRTYSLRVVPDGVELWRTIATPGEEDLSVRESLFQDSDETSRFLDEVRRALRAGGWHEQ